MPRRNGFTLIELMVVIAIIAALAAVLVPAVSGIVERARFVKCGSNFNTIGKQLRVYDRESAGVFPTVRRAPVNSATKINDSPTDLTATDNWAEVRDPLLNKLGYCAMQEVWPLIQTGMLNVTAFKCPNDTMWRPRMTELKYGWTSPYQFSYGIQWPYPGVGNEDTLVATTVNKATPYGKKREDRLVVLADKNPGGQVSAGRKQHSNHPDIGACGVEAGGSAMLYDKPTDSKCGMNQNDIYVDNNEAKTGVIGQSHIPKDVDDTVIVPFKFNAAEAPE